MKLLKLAMVVGVTLSLAHAQNFVAPREGAGNGGQSVYQGDVAYLRDIVEKNNCVFNVPSQVLKKFPTLTAISNKMADVHPTLARQWSYNFDKLVFCFTDKYLIPLAYNNSDDLYNFPNDEYKQVAIFDQGIVFISNPVFNSMNETNKAYTILHESLHTFYDLKVPRQEREPALRQFVMNIKQSFNDLSRELVDVLISQARFKWVDSVSGDLDSFHETMYSTDQEEAFKGYLNLTSRGLTLNSLRAFELKAEFPNFFKGLLSNRQPIEDMIYFAGVLNEKEATQLKHAVVNIRGESLYADSELHRFLRKLSLNFNYFNLDEHYQLKDFGIYRISKSETAINNSHRLFGPEAVCLSLSQLPNLVLPVVDAFNYTDACYKVGSQHCGRITWVEETHNPITLHYVNLNCSREIKGKLLQRAYSELENFKNLKRWARLNLRWSNKLIKQQKEFGLSNLDIVIQTLK